MVTSDVELQDQVADAITPEQIIDTLDQAAMHAVADRLAYLRNLAAHDPEEPTLQLDSLRALADCLMRHRELPDPRIATTPNGLLMVDWRVPPDANVAIGFTSTTLTRFAAVSDPAEPGVERPRVDGTLPLEDALAALRSFTSRIERT